MFSDDELLLLYGTVACVIVKRRRRFKRNVWAKDWLLKRIQYSHINLLKELRFHPKDWHNFTFHFVVIILRRYFPQAFFFPKQLNELKEEILTPRSHVAENTMKLK